MRVSRILRPILGQGQRVHQTGVRPQLRITDVDGRRVQAFVTNRPGHANRLDVLHRVCVINSL